MRLAQRTAPAAHWAPWADGLSMIAARSPRIANNAVESLKRGPTGCLEELARAAEMLKREGFGIAPDWDEQLRGARPPEPNGDADVGE